MDIDFSDLCIDDDVLIDINTVVSEMEATCSAFDTDMAVQEIYMSAILTNGIDRDTAQLIREVIKDEEFNEFYINESFTTYLSDINLVAACEGMLGSAARGVWNVISSIFKAIWAVISGIGKGIAKLFGYKGAASTELSSAADEAKEAGDKIDETKSKEALSNSDSYEKAYRALEAYNSPVMQIIMNCDDALSAPGRMRTDLVESKARALLDAINDGTTKFYTTGADSKVIDAATASINSCITDLRSELKTNTVKVNGLLENMIKSVESAAKKSPHFDLFDKGVTSAIKIEYGSGDKLLNATAMAKRLRAYCDAGYMVPTDKQKEIKLLPYKDMLRWVEDSTKAFKKYKSIDSVRDLIADLTAQSKSTTATVDKYSKTNTNMQNKAADKGAVALQQALAASNRVLTEYNKFIMQVISVSTATLQISVVATRYATKLRTGLRSWTAEAGKLGGRQNIENDKKPKKEDENATD